MSFYADVMVEYVRLLFPIEFIAVLTAALLINAFVYALLLVTDADSVRIVKAARAVTAYSERKGKLFADEKKFIKKCVNKLPANFRRSWKAFVRGASSDKIESDIEKAGGEYARLTSKIYAYVCLIISMGAIIGLALSGLSTENTVIGCTVIALPTVFAVMTVSLISSLSEYRLCAAKKQLINFVRAVEIGRSGVVSDVSPVKVQMKETLIEDVCAEQFGEKDFSGKYGCAEKSVGQDVAEQKSDYSKLGEIVKKISSTCSKDAKSEVEHTLKHLLNDVEEGTDAEILQSLIDTVK